MLRTPFLQCEVPYIAGRYASKSDSLEALFPSDRHKIEAKVSLALLTRSHYKSLKVNDSLSSVAFLGFIDQIDGAKMYLTSKEIQDLREKHGHRLGNIIENGELQPIYDIYALYRKRLLEYVSYTEKWIEKGFDFRQRRVHKC